LAHLPSFLLCSDLKPENVLLHRTGHCQLTDFDLSYICKSKTQPELLELRPSSATSASLSRPSTNGAAPSFDVSTPSGGGSPRSLSSSAGMGGSSMGVGVSLRRGSMMLAAQPSARTNSLVGTEEYVAPEIIQGTGGWVWGVGRCVGA